MLFFIYQTYFRPVLIFVPSASLNLHRWAALQETQF